MKTDFSTTRYLCHAMLRYQIRTPNHQPLTSFPNVQEISANINWVKQTDWMLRGTFSWPESGSYWPVWVAGGDFLFWSSTHSLMPLSPWFDILWPWIKMCNIFFQENVTYSILVTVCSWIVAAAMRWQKSLLKIYWGLQILLATLFSLIVSAVSWIPWRPY